MTSDDFPAMIYSGTGVFGSVKSAVTIKGTNKPTSSAI